jgi:DNA-binding NarL/FixJ family response regulator
MAITANMTSRKIIRILLAEPSSIVAEGFCNLLNRKGNRFYINITDSYTELKRILPDEKPDIVVINPVFIQNNTTLAELKQEFHGAKWIGLVYAYFDPKLLSIMDALIQINDTPDDIISILQKQADAHNPEEEAQPSLTERETEVLKFLVAGHSNKEIADRLSISTHTVITHRKNITQKTGIRTVSGLTIYSVVKHITNLENYK